jgi:hypothetical protein
VHVFDDLADAVLVYRSRELSLGALVATVQLEEHADCDIALRSLQHQAWLHRLDKLGAEIVKQKGKALVIRFTK